MNCQAHEYADLFPMMDGEAFEELKQDIRENGLLEPKATLYLGDREISHADFKLLLEKK